MKKPRVEFNSQGESGNIYAILSRVRAVFRAQRRINDYNEIYFAVANSASYTEALAIIRQKVDLIDLDGKV